MPSKNIVKTYVENGYYHVYNRGVEKREVFLDKQDCVVFQRYLKLYLGDPEEVRKIDIPRVKSFLKYNMRNELQLLAFSLMPNHIHLLIKQRDKDSISKFMRRLITSYVMYFNRKYNRVGPLFQNRYKAALVQTDPYLLHLSRYIHLNPQNINHSKIDFQDFSSYPYYKNEKIASWLNINLILDYFKNKKFKQKGDSYIDFVENYKEKPEKLLGGLVIETQEI